MKFSSSTLFVLACMLVGNTAALQSACRDGPILRQSTIIHDGKEIQIATRVCTNLDNATTPGIERRQSPECGFCAHFFCSDSGTQPLVSDCVTLANALEALDGSFVAQAETSQQFSHSSCAYSFTNASPTPFNFTYSAFGEGGLSTADDCFEPFDSSGTAGSATCLPLQSGSCVWSIEVFNPLSS